MYKKANRGRLKENERREEERERIQKKKKTSANKIPK